MFPTYLKYRATATSTQPSHATVVAKVSEPSNVVHKTPTPSTSRQEMPTMPTQSDFKAKTILPSSPSSNFLPTQLGLGEEDPKLKNQPFSNKIMENSNSSLRNSISIQLSPVQPKSSQEKVPVITLDWWQYNKLCILHFITDRPIINYLYQICKILVFVTLKNVRKCNEFYSIRHIFFVAPLFC